jgi:predicted CXXCH cytochrome family protein
VAAQHPQKGKDTFKLSQNVPELCFSCHTPLGKKPYTHPPVKSGMCTSCHNPHASDEPRLLTQPRRLRNFVCHVTLIR